MMNKNKFEDKMNGCGVPAEMRSPIDGGEEDVRVNEALTDFRTSVRAWSDAAYGRSRGPELTVRHRSWRLAVGWMLASVLVAGTVTGGLMEHQRREEAAKAAAQHAHEQQMAVAKQQTRQQDRKLMTTVDNEISQQVPSAMEPLAQLMQMDDGETP